MTCEMGNISDANMLFGVVTAVLFLTFTLYVTAPEWHNRHFCKHM